MTLFSFEADRWRQNSSLANIEDVVCLILRKNLLQCSMQIPQDKSLLFLRISFGKLEGFDGDRYLERFYYRLRNVALSYNVDASIIAKSKFLTGLRVYVLVII